jgi:patatin-like phospholipase/acyl hydrolase
MATVTTTPALKTVLSIDGGGIRGVIPARVLREIEQRMDRPISELFDLVAGTSTGGILALGLTLPKPGTTTPAWDAAALQRLYVEHGAKIFANSLLRKVETLGGLFEERYEAGEIERVLRHYFGDAMLSSALTEVVVPSYDLTAPAPFFFKRSYARDQTHTWDVETWKAARATSAAPTYFDPMNLPAFEDEGEHALVDGGVFANNPTACAYAEALNLYGRASDVAILSLGTGDGPPHMVRYLDARGWGVIHWARPIIDVVFDGVAKTVDYQMIRLCRSETQGEQLYHRIQRAPLHTPATMDDASPSHVQALLGEAEALLAQAETQVTLDAICALLARRLEAIAAAPV